ncbi:MAG: hypothetical protein CM15mV34_0470 [Caudoviricetes sp.]|nr:MAG: hypothetical protein CM15mV34_0470 [Caudoviricetes sp.]
MYLNYRWGMNGYSFGYDDYVLNRKQFAMRSGSATLAKNSLAFHEKFGLNYKIELILTNCEFEETTIVDGNPHYDNCLGCLLLVLLTAYELQNGFRSSRLGRLCKFCRYTCCFQRP